MMRRMMKVMVRVSETLHPGVQDTVKNWINSTLQYFIGGKIHESQIFGLNCPMKDFLLYWDT